ncbi:MAG: hypothetical protein FJ212_06485 [Ignavibacteria bacterium]|nr:hypothetical protein [Ignavibacteria bacterium]
MKLMLYISILLMFLSLDVNAQKTMRGVWGAGGTTANSGSSVIHGTLSQTAIGRCFEKSGEVRSGFWYTMRSSLPKNNVGIIVVLPVFSGKAGQTVEMPIIIESSQKLPFGTLWSFTGSFTYNATVLEPMGGHDSFTRVNDIGTIRFSGTSTDTAGIIKKITFRVKLGNEAISAVTWDSFAIKEHPKAVIIKKNGQFQLEDLCFTDGKPRLISTLKQGLALSAFPLPAKGSLTVATSIVEQEPTEILMYAPDGKMIGSLHEGTLKPGYHELKIDTEFIPSGTYFIIMKTPSDLLTTPCVIAK